MARQYSPEEREAALAALAANQYVLQRTADQLGISRHTMHHWLHGRDAPQEFGRFKKRFMSTYQNPLHLWVLDNKLLQVGWHVASRGKWGIGRLLVEFPPRHGKTTVVSRLFPAWFLGKNPDKRVMLVSYAASLAEKNSRAVRRIFMSHAFREMFDLRLAKDNWSVPSWDIAGHSGGLDALGIGGAATGKGADLLVIDDPIKNREEAESWVMRDKIWESFTDDFYTRLEPGGAVVVMATRWHADDLIGRILKHDTNGEWTRLRLPALAEENDPLGRAPGDALWPQRFPAAELGRIHKTLGDYSFAALYQQQPVPAEGGIFKRVWFEPLIDETPRITRAWRYWDLAMSERTSADYTVGVKLGQDRDGVFYVLDVARRQIGWDQLVGFMAEVMLADGPDVMQGVEQKGYMSRAVQELNRDPRLHRFTINGFDVDNDKLTRALPFSAKCGAGLVRILNRHWTAGYVEELCSFPKGAHDDQVDASSGAWAMAAEDAGGMLTITYEYYA